MDSRGAPDAPGGEPAAATALRRPAVDEAGLRRLRRLVRLLDEAVRVPGTRLRVGLDGLLGLLPGGGDAVGALLAGWVVVAAARMGASPSLLARMLWNVAVDAAAGSVPLLGDLFDLGWKANRRNLDLLEEHLADPAAALRASRLRVAAAAAGVLATVAALVAFLWWIARAVIGL